MANVIHKLTVFESDDGQQHTSAVFETQDCGRIVGGGTCPQPLRIELAPLYKAAPQMREALSGVAVMLRTELKRYASEPWAQRVMSAIEST